jgi:dolichol-phosphate mannosyltransferase
MKTYFYYSIHDLISIRSERRLPELGYFKSDTVLTTFDLDVQIVPNPKKHKTASSICYQEILGNFGFSIVINRDEAMTKIFASMLIGMSPHVLYTNVVEPLIRWTLVRKGYALMHGACISFDGKALFITAQTDTGKTTTILHTLRNNVNNCEFLSDDMTIMSTDGHVMSYPKPLTISQHTVQAVGGAPLSFTERFFLKIQSRLHSKGGRRVGMWLSHNKTPAATLNAIVQILIPPPKFMVHKLVPGTRYVGHASLSHIVLIERGPDFEGPLAEDSKVAMLLANADDAYGFPPYPVLADQLRSWQGKDLHEAEKAIVASAIQTLPGVHLKSSSYDWYKRLPQLVHQASSYVSSLNTQQVPAIPLGLGDD